MKERIIVKKLLICLSLALALASCGDSDEDPAPVMDCNATGPTVSATSTASACGEDDGEINLSVTGGTGNLAVTIEPQPIGVSFSNNIFSNVEPGTYTVRVTDDDNCTSSTSITVDFSASNLSYQADIDPIIESKCAIAGCHVDGTGRADFTIFAEFQALANNNAGGVRQRVKTGDMPRSGSLTAQEISAIFCWIDEGAQNN